VSDPERSRGKPIGHCFGELSIVLDPGRKIRVRPEREIRHEYGKVTPQSRHALAIVAGVNPQAGQEEDRLTVAVDFDRDLESVESEVFASQHHARSYERGPGRAIGASSARSPRGASMVAGIVAARYVQAVEIQLIKDSSLWQGEHP
jgi:hypothetical protein